MLGITSLSKMSTALLLMMGIHTTAAFNIYTVPVVQFKQEDPLFGQIIVQSKDGVFVPSPNSGEVFKCDLVNNCSKVDDFVGRRKGLRPVTSAASSWTEEKLLVCNQVQTRMASNEDFNGHCSLWSNQMKEEISPASLVTKNETNSNKTMKHERTCHDNNSNNNNNKYYFRDNPTGYNQVHRRMRREAEKNDKETDEDEDAGTEIAFVLDGSGSIDYDDFERAKNFIFTVMTKVWTSCFSCNFAIVQFGTIIRTELSLLENENVTKALEKVKNIKQAYNYTRTASALHHLLTEVFVPQNGSKKNAKKMIILLSDGEMMGDDRNLEEVLNMPEMEGIKRFAIGVGPQVVNKPRTIQQMIQIAGDKERYFNVSNYSALVNILSTLEESIIGIEGIQMGAGFHLQLAEAGFSSHLTHEGSMLFGAVGAYDWSGGVILKREKDKTVTFLNASTEEPRFSYLGYSVASAHAAGKTLYISGAPRYNLTGGVFVFDGTCEDVLPGDQVGSYFGAVLCALDVDDNKETDHLLVGAPHFNSRGEEGKVLVYKLNQGKFERAGELKGMERFDYARFGSAIATIGDVDGNKHTDVAVGAPLEAHDMTGASGSIYIFNGFKDGIKQEYSQRISPSDLGMRLVHFGQAVSALSSLEGKNLISVGSEGAVTVLKSLPVIVINTEIKVHLEVPLTQQTNDRSKLNDMSTPLQICFDAKRNRITGSEELLIEYHFDLDSGKEEKRVSCDNCPKRANFTVTASKSCTDPSNLNFVGCYDCFSPIIIKLNFTLIAPSSGTPVRVLDVFSPKEVIKQIRFERECKIKDSCQSNISLTDSKLSTDTVIIGLTQTLEITFNFTNTGDSSYMTTLTLTYPAILFPKLLGKNGECEVKNDNLQIMCKLLHPDFKRAAQMALDVTWQPKTRSDLRNATITAVLTGGNDGTQTLDSKNYSFGLKNALAVQLIGKATPQRLNITDEEISKQENKKEELQFIFELLGKNEYQANINVTITIDKKASNIILKILSVEPMNCIISDNSKNKHLIECSLTDVQKITIKTIIQMHNIQGNYEKIVATAKLSFDKSIYEGIDITNKEVEVILSKLTVVKSTALIIGGSIGGLLFLIILIIILIKCGFFRRRHKLQRDESLH